MSMNKFVDDGISSRSVSRQGQRQSQTVGENFQSDCSLDQIEDYIEKLYEDLNQKVVGARCILSLARQTENLSILMRNENLMSALTRVLMEDGKRSLDLCATILNIFLQFSFFAELQGALMQLKIGDASLKIVEREIERCKLWKDELGVGNDEKDLERMQKLRSMMKKQDAIFFAALQILLNMIDDIGVQIKTIKRGVLTSLVHIVCDHFNRKVLEPNPDLVKLLLRFLKTLSVYSENVQKLAKYELLNDFIMRLTGFIHHENKEIGISVLCLLCNYAQNQSVRAAVSRAPNVLEKLSQSINDADDQESNIALNLLYLLSLDEYCVEQLPSTNILPSMMRQILEYRGSRTPVSLAGCVCNAAKHLRNAETICGLSGIQDKNNGLGLKLVFKKATKMQDPVLFKLLNILASRDCPDIKNLFLPFLPDFFTIIENEQRQTDSESKTIISETFGILASIFNGPARVSQYDKQQFNFYAVLEAYLADMVHREQKLNSDSTIPPNLSEDDDILLGIIRLLRSLAHDPVVFSNIANTNIIPLIIQQMFEKSDDTTIVEHTLGTIAVYLSNENPCQQIIIQHANTLIPFIEECLYEDCKQMADSCLAALQEALGDVDYIDDAIVERVKRARFIAFNDEWSAAANIKANAPADDELNVDNFDESVLYGEIIDNDPLYDEAMQLENESTFLDQQRFFLSSLDLSVPTSS